MSRISNQCKLQQFYYIYVCNSKNIQNSYFLDPFNCKLSVTFYIEFVESQPKTKCYKKNLMVRQATINV